MLAQFLRTRREALSPERAGLRAGSRRRTPGLRREEVATLAGVSIDYLVRLEQGRDSNPSTEVLVALAGALQLDADETRHMIGLAAVGASPHLEGLCPDTPSLDAEVPRTVAILVNQLEPTPAFVIGPLGDVLMANGVWRALVGPLGLAEGSNIGRHLFLDPAAPGLYADWEGVADHEVARLRTAHRFLERDRRFSTLIEDLSDAPEFERRWRGHPVAGTRRSGLVLVHPEVGILRIDQEPLALATEDQQLVCWVPSDEATADALRRATIRDGASGSMHLRVVGDA